MAENTPYVKEAGDRSGLVVLAGMELQTREEIHVIAIFDDYDTAYALQLMVYDLLPPGANDVEFWGDQVVVDGEDNIVRSEERLLISSAGISIEDAVAWIKSHGGIAIASHIDSPTFSIISQLVSYRRTSPSTLWRYVTWKRRKASGLSSRGRASPS
jgi:predicted metal-dependent phosphoesterase TrpH